jgi:hypothetical protein
VQRFVEGVRVEFCLYNKGGAKGGEEVLTNGPSVTCGVGECGGVNFDANSYLQNS